MKRTTLRNAGIASVASMAVFSGCSSDKKSYENWMETSGTANRINLEAVQKALEKAESVNDFENAVNEIYEGPHLVLIEIVDEGNGKKKISGYEDVDNNKILNTNSDFLLFSSTVGGDSYELRGAGAHSYYHHTGYYGGSGMGTGLMLGYVMGSMMSRSYTTPMGRGMELNNYRDSYRSSPAYSAQKQQNTAFRKAQLAKNPSAAKGFRSNNTSGFKSKGSGFRSGS